MYHDEFGKRPARRESFGENALPPRVLEVGCGLWMVLAASLNQTLSALLIQIGGLLPLIVCSGTIMAHRCSEVLDRLSRTIHPASSSRVPVPHLGLASASGAVRARRLVREESTRAGFDRSGRLG